VLSFLGKPRLFEKKHQAHAAQRRVRPSFVVEGQPVQTPVLHLPPHEQAHLVDPFDLSEANNVLGDRIVPTIALPAFPSSNCRPPDTQSPDSTPQRLTLSVLNEANRLLLVGKRVSRPNILRRASPQPAYRHSAVKDVFRGEVDIANVQIGAPPKVKNVFLRNRIAS